MLARVSLRRSPTSASVPRSSVSSKRWMSSSPYVSEIAHSQLGQRRLTSQRAPLALEDRQRDALMLVASSVADRNA